jgi:subtilisin family serine protease
MFRLVHDSRAVGICLVLILLLLGVFLLFFNVGQTQVQESSLIDRQIVLMMKPGVVDLGQGRIRAAIDEGTLPLRMRALLQEAGAQEIAKGMPEFQRSDTLRVFPDGRVYRAPDYTNVFVITLPADVPREALVDSLARLPEVISVEKNQRVIFRETVPTSEPYFGYQWNMKNTGQSSGTAGADIKATFAWDLTKGSNTVKLGLVDSGVKADHEDFGGRISGDAGYNTFHGTQVAGIMAAVGDNGKGIAGVDWRARIVSQRTGLNDNDIPSIAAAVDQAVADTVRVLNNSWGVNSYSSLLYTSFRAAHRANVLSIVANAQTGAAEHADYPNSFGTWVMSVAATTNTDAKAGYSLSRRYTDIAAPGGNHDGIVERDILSTIPPNTNTYDYDWGTSFAAPHVTGVAGLMLAKNINLRNYDIEWILNRAADPKGSTPYPNLDFGYGRLNAYEAVRRVSAPYQITHGSATLTQTDTNIRITFLNPPDLHPEGLASGDYWCDRYKMEAIVSFPQPYNEIPW